MLGGVTSCRKTSLNILAIRGRSPNRGRIYVRGSLSLIITFQLAGREESIYGYMRAVVILRAVTRNCPCKPGWVHSAPGELAMESR